MFQDFPEMFLCFGNPAVVKSQASKSHQVVAMVFIALIQVLVKHEKIRERNREVIDLDRIVEVFLTEINQSYKNGLCLCAFSKSPPRKTLVEDLIGLLTM